MKMELEETEFGFKATIPLITEDEMKKINDDFDNTINKFLDIIIKDKDLATAQYIIKKQQEQINELKRNSISKKKIEKLIKELKTYLKYAVKYANTTEQTYTSIELNILQELLKDK